MEQVTAYVRGRVQGVSFRYYTQKEALRLGLKGWVRNEHDGSVQVLAVGPKKRLEDMVDFLHQGPSFAKVDRVDITWSTATLMFENFEIRWL